MLVFVAFLIAFCWAFAAIAFQRAFFARNAKLAFESVAANSEFRAFGRGDYVQWNKFRFTLLCATLLPLRLAAFAFAVTFGTALLYAIDRLHKLSVNRLKGAFLLASLARLLIRKVTAALLFAFGVRIRVRRAKASAAHSDLVFLDDEALPHISVSNHVSWIDVMFVLSRLGAGFISKSDARNLPLIGFVTRYIGTLFVDREDSADRTRAMLALQRRADLIRANGRENALHVFPEGTTTNGKFVLRFRRGAFAMGLPIKLLCLKYRGRFCPAMNLISDADSFIGVLCEPRTYLECVELVGLVAAPLGASPADFAAAVERLYEREFGLECLPQSYADKMRFEESVAREAAAARNGFKSAQRF